MEIPNNMGRDIRLPPKLWEEIRALSYSVLEEDTDLVFVIDGNEGVGKSKAARLVGAAFATELGVSFGVENIHYSTQEYMEASSRMGKFSVHILDEAGVILHRGSAASRDAKRFTKFLQVARGGNNQIHIVVLPAYHLLDGYVVNWRSRFVMHMFSEKEKTDDPRVPGCMKMKRGAFKLWTKCDALTYNYHLAAEKHIYKYPTSNPFLFDRVPNAEVLSPQEELDLQAKKEKWRNDFINDDQKQKLNNPQKKALAALRKTVKFLVVNQGWKLEAVAEYIGYSSRQISTMIAENNEGTKDEV
jgi:hypothetical protein